LTAIWIPWLSKPTARYKNSDAIIPFILSIDAKEPAHCEVL